MNIIIYLILSFYSLAYSTTPETLTNQKNKPPSEFYREFKPVKHCKLEYVYNINGKTTFSKNYVKNSRLISRTSYKNSKKKDVFIYFEECLNEDCYSEKQKGLRSILIDGYN